MNDFNFTMGFLINVHKLMLIYMFLSPDLLTRPNAAKRLCFYTLVYTFILWLYHMINFYDIYHMINLYICVYVLICFRGTHGRLVLIAKCVILFK